MVESLVLLVRMEGFGPPACGLEVRERDFSPIIT